MAEESVANETIDLDEILTVAKEAAMLAGKEMRNVMLTSKSDEAATKSNSVDLVTATDQKCEELVLNLLRSKYPQHEIIGEESVADGKYELTDSPTWTVDPIDGTTNFVHRLSLSCNLVAFLMNKEPVVGVTYDPMANELFWAVKGKGAYMTTREGETRKIQVSRTTSLQKALISMDAGYGRDETNVDKYIAVQRSILLQKVRHVRVLGSCGLTLAYVACGRLDACFEEGSWEINTGPKIWDFSAGKLMIKEAGGVTHDLTDRKSKSTELDLLQRSVFAAASPELAKQLLDTIYDS